MQQSDPTLAPLLKTAKDKEQVVDPVFCSSKAFILKGGILYRQQRADLQLVVPGAARETVLTLGYSVPSAGHLGKHRNFACIKNHFHWSGLHKDVAQFCKSCPQCQKTSTINPIQSSTLAPTNYQYPI